MGSDGHRTPPPSTTQRRVTQPGSGRFKFHSLPPNFLSRFLPPTPTLTHFRLGAHEARYPVKSSPNRERERESERERRPGRTQQAHDMRGSRLRFLTCQWSGLPPFALSPYRKGWKRANIATEKTRARTKDGDASTHTHTHTHTRTCTKEAKKCCLFVASVSSLPVERVVSPSPAPSLTSQHNTHTQAMPRRGAIFFSSHGGDTSEGSLLPVRKHNCSRVGRLHARWLTTGFSRAPAFQCVSGGDWSFFFPPRSSVSVGPLYFCPASPRARSPQLTTI